MEKNIIIKIMTTKICAILIGIRYAVGGGHLKGCHNDVINIYNYLKTLYPNNEIDYIILADSENNICDSHKCIWPSRSNIISTLKDVRGKYKKYFIHYSGHGASITDWSGDESDWKDEVLCPYDYATAGIIKDDTLNSEFLQYLDSDCYVRILMDCCRSGTIWDLKYKYTSNNVEKNSSAPDINCNVIALSGCKDNQYSYDVYTSGQSQGAFTHCFLKSIKSNMRESNSNMKDLINKINENLISGGWSAQTSRLTSSFMLKDKDTFFNFNIVDGDTIDYLSNEDNINNNLVIDNEFYNLFSFCSIQ